jgi:phage-related protein
MEFPKAKPLIPIGRSLDDLREAPVEVRRALRTILARWKAAQEDYRRRYGKD